MKKNVRARRGFTLAELLIGVAIIAVLVAVSIPVFSNRVERSREATDLANVRAAYAKVMMAATSHDTQSPNADGVSYEHDRWYINVTLTQKIADWQGKSDLTVGGFSSTDPHHWVGKPSAGGTCTISYSEDGDVVFAWVYNFAQIMGHIKIPSDPSLPQKYWGKTVVELLTQADFSMLESSGGTGKFITSEIKHQLGLNNTDYFSYKVLPAKGYPKGSGYYEFYISTERDLNGKTGQKNNSAYGEMAVTGYLYKIESDGSSNLITTGTTQTINTYTNKDGQEKMDVYGDQNTGTPKPDSPVYEWPDD